MSQPSNSPTLVTPTGGTPSGDMGHEEIIDFLKDEGEEVIDLGDKAKPKPTTVPEEKVEEEKEEEKPTEEEIDELRELEAELEEPTEEQLELMTPVRRKEILAKYPNLFKEFPYLERAYYREQQFTELLPTIEDAKAAVEAKEVLERFETDIMDGNTENLLKAIKSDSPNGFAKLVDQYLPTLAKVDEQACFHVLGNITKHTIVAMVREAKRSNNEVLQSAAQILNQFVFGTSEFRPPTQLARQTPQEDEKGKELQQREQRFVAQQFESTRDDLNTRINNTLRNTIDANIDPKKSMTDYVRKNASREAIEMLESLLSKDARFIALKDKLWESAFSENFTKTSVDRIKSAYLSRAKTLLPTVIKKARIDALKGLGKRVSEDETPDKSPITPGRPRSQESNKSGKITNPKDIPAGMRTIDFLNQE